MTLTSVKEMLKLSGDSLSFVVFVVGDLKLIKTKVGSLKIWWNTATGMRRPSRGVFH